MFGSIPPVTIPAPRQPTGCSLHNMRIKGGGGVCESREKKKILCACYAGPALRTRGWGIV